MDSIGQVVVEVVVVVAIFTVVDVLVIAEVVGAAVLVEKVVIMAVVVAIEAAKWRLGKKCGGRGGVDDGIQFLAELSEYDLHRMFVVSLQ